MLRARRIGAKQGGGKQSFPELAARTKLTQTIKYSLYPKPHHTPTATPSQPRVTSSATIAASTAPERLDLPIHVPPGVYDPAL